MTRRIVRVQRDAQNDNNNGHLAPRCGPYKRPDRRGNCPHTARPAPVPRSHIRLELVRRPPRRVFNRPTRPFSQGTRNAVVRPHGPGHHHHVAAASPAGRPRVARRRARRNTHARLAPVLLLPGKPRVSCVPLLPFGPDRGHRAHRANITSGLAGKAALSTFTIRLSVRQDETFRSKR